MMTIEQTCESYSSVVPVASADASRVVDRDLVVLVSNMIREQARVSVRS
jgi:hypothetical protein